MASLLELYAKILLAGERVDDTYFARLFGLIEGLSDDGADVWTPNRKNLRALHHVLDSDAVKPSFPPSKISDRAAFIMRAVLNFSTEVTAKVLDEKNEIIERKALRGRDEFVQKFPATVMIIEDEPIIALDLQNIVASIGYQVVGVAETQSQALSMAKNYRPTLVLADLNLGEGGSGLIAVREIFRTRRVPTIFITAYPEKLLIADRPEPTFLIAKPFRPEAIKMTVMQVLSHSDDRFSNASWKPTPEPEYHQSSRPPETLPSVSSGAPQSQAKGPSSVIIRNRTEVALYVDHLVTVLEPVLTYDKSRHHNRPPPEMWVDDEVYLAQIHKVVIELREIRTAISAPAETAMVEPAIINLRKHLNTFLENYAATLGKGAAMGTLLLFVALLARTGWGSDALERAATLIKKVPD